MSKRAKFRRVERCFSRSGWWQTLCGLDSANQGFGWSDEPRYVGCKDCRALIRKRAHWSRRLKHILVPLWQHDLIMSVRREKGDRA